MNCNTTHYRANSSSVPGDPTDFASDDNLQLARFLPAYQGGAQMLLNAINWALEDDALTEVRSKILAH